MKRDLILARKVNNQHCIDDMVHYVKTGDILIVGGHTCETNKTNDTMGNTDEDLSYCACRYASVVDGDIPCNGCGTQDIYLDEPYTLMNFE